MKITICFLQYAPVVSKSFICTNIRKASVKSEGCGRRRVISANSLEESKRRAKSQYDNIPDLNQQYISELNWAERKYGPKVVKKDISKEAQKSILKRTDVMRSQSTSTASEGTMASGQSDLSEYTRIRNQLIGNTLFVGLLGICGMWGFGTLKNVQSYSVGLVGSLAYIQLLSRSVDRLADGAKGGGGSSGDALQPARVAILVILVIASAKNSDKLDVLPVLFGFFTYKLATLVPLLTGEAFE